MKSSPKFALGIVVGAAACSCLAALRTAPEPQQQASPASPTTQPAGLQIGRYQLFGGNNGTPLYLLDTTSGGTWNLKSGSNTRFAWDRVTPAVEP